MLEKLQAAEEKYRSLEASLSNPAVAQDPARCAEVAKEYKLLTPIIEKYRELQNAKKAAADALEILEESTDAELRTLANEELKSAKEEIDALEHELTVMLLPRDPNDENLRDSVPRCSAKRRQSLADTVSLPFRWKETAPIPASNTKAAYTAYSAFPKQNPREEYTPLPSPSQFSPRQMTLR